MRLGLLVTTTGSRWVGAHFFHDYFIIRAIIMGNYDGSFALLVERTVCGSQKASSQLKLWSVFLLLAKLIYAHSYRIALD